MFSRTLSIAEMRVVETPVLTSEFAMKIDSQTSGGSFELMYHDDMKGNYEPKETRYAFFCQSWNHHVNDELSFQMINYHRKKQFSERSPV